MIIDMQRKFIFVHNPKTGGTSIRTALSIFNSGSKYKANTKHESISNFKKRTKLDLTGYIIFGLVRNPWDRFASTYHYIKEKWSDKYPMINNVRDVNEFTHHLGEDWTKPIYSLKPQHSYFDESCIIAKFENMEEDLSIIFNALSIAKKIKKMNQSTNKYYERQFNQDAQEMVAEFYREDIERYDYEFPHESNLTQ